jgi:Inner membrane protein YgaP-like, transmembrane domain
MDKLLPHNEHAVDRAVRIALGIVLLALVFAGPHTPWGWLGLVPLATGLIGSCPLYTLFGLSTCRTHGGPGHAHG